MDDKWFKQQQKKAGVTADQIAERLGRDRSLVSRIYVGRQKMTLEQAKVFATSLDQPLEVVLQKAGITDTSTAHKVSIGFSEGDVVPFVTKQGTQPKAMTTAETLGGGRPGVNIWKVGSDAMIMQGYLPNDFILVDEKSTHTCKAGDVVLAQVFNGKTATANTLLRRYEPPVLVSATTNGDKQRVHVVDGINVVLTGKVIASWRS